MKDIVVNGITNPRYINNYYHSIPNTSIKSFDNLLLSKNAFPIYKILRIDIDVNISSGNLEKSSINNTLSIIGYKNIKIFYLSEDLCKIHRASFNIPFTSQILYPLIPLKFIKTKIAVESLKIKLLSCKNFIINTLIFICPIIECDTN